MGFESKFKKGDILNINFMLSVTCTSMTTIIGVDLVYMVAKRKKGTHPYSVQAAFKGIII